MELLNQGHWILGQPQCLAYHVPSSRLAEIWLIFIFASFPSSLVLRSASRNRKVRPQGSYSQNILVCILVAGAQVQVQRYLEYLVGYHCRLVVDVMALTIFVSESRLVEASCRFIEEIWSYNEENQVARFCIRCGREQEYPTVVKGWLRPFSPFPSLSGQEW